MSTEPKLFQPIEVGDAKLQHRVVLAPLTRYRADATHVPTELMAEYYSQRACVPGTLLITEATFIAAKAGGYNHVPGIWSEAQVAGWKKVTDAVHARGSFIYVQLWALGRAADPAVLKKEDPDFPYVSASDVQLTGFPHPPRPLTIPEIQEYVQLYSTAASNAVKAGFDGVEIHSANGYLIDQFLQGVSNRRTDEYGGTVENRSRFGLEVVDAIVKAIGASKVGIRLSPWGTFQDMRMKDPIPTFSHFAKRIRELHPDFAYLHVTEPRVTGNIDRDVQSGESNDFLRQVWSPKPFIAAGGFTRESAIATSDKYGDLIAFGRYYISNPDIVLRLKKEIPLTPYNRQVFYTPLKAEGYIDYPFAEDIGTQQKL